MERLSGPAEEARFIIESGVAARVSDLVEPVLESMGYRLVLVRLMGGSDAILEIMAERADGTMAVEDCEAVSHAVSPLLDVQSWTGRSPDSLRSASSQAMESTTSLGGSNPGRPMLTMN
jgi:hypothetical protein